MMTLVTGAAGFIGLNVVENLLAAGLPVVAHSLAPLPAPAMAAFAGLPGRLEVVTGDICDVVGLRSVFARYDIDRVLHTAALTVGPAVCGEAAVPAFKVNVGGTAAILQVAREAGVQRLVLTSSTAVYGQAPFLAEPLTETTAASPLTVYGYTKVAAEALVDQARDFGLDTVTARLTAIFGPWEYDTGVRATLSPPFQIARAALRGEPVVLAENGRRDWTNSIDIARALVELLFATAPAHRLYNLGVGRIWHPGLLCEALAERIPGFAWRVGAPHETPSVDYNDDLQRTRVSPPAPGRFEAEFGSVFGTPEAAAQAYADWVVQRGRGLIV